MLPDVLTEQHVAVFEFNQSINIINDQAQISSLDNAQDILKGVTRNLYFDSDNDPNIDYAFGTLKQLQNDEYYIYWCAYDVVNNTTVTARQARQFIIDKLVERYDMLTLKIQDKYINFGFNLIHIN